MSVVSFSLRKHHRSILAPLTRFPSSSSASYRSFSLLEKSHAKSILQKTDAVCFDVDSTVINEEGIDVLAEYNGAGAAVAEWTRK